MTKRFFDDGGYVDMSSYTPDTSYYTPIDTSVSPDWSAMSSGTAVSDPTATDYSLPDLFSGGYSTGSNDGTYNIPTDGYGSILTSGASGGDGSMMQAGNSQVGFPSSMSSGDVGGGIAGSGASASSPAQSGGPLSMLKSILGGGSNGKAGSNSSTLTGMILAQVLAQALGIGRAKQANPVQNAQNTAAAARAMQGAYWNSGQFTPQNQAFMNAYMNSVPSSVNAVMSHNPEVATHNYAHGGEVGPLAHMAQNHEQTGFNTNSPLRLVSGTAPGQQDNVDAKLSPGEYVFDSDSVSALGDGNNAAGAKALDQLRHNLRAHKRSAPPDKIPPKAKKPEEYMKGEKA